MDEPMDTHDQPQAGPSRGTAAVKPPTVDISFDLDDLANLEQHFYNTGYTDGFSHGRIHGLIEGRQLGVEKGFEIWEEVGFYEGFARTWTSLLALSSSAAAAGSGQGQGNGQAADGGKTRAQQGLVKLLGLIERFPTTNPSPSASGMSELPSALEMDEGDVPTPPENVDIPALLARIRAQYRTVCAALGVRPRMAVAPSEGVELGRKLAF